MAEELKIVVGADVSGAIAGIGRMTRSLKDTENLFANLVDSTGDFGKAIDELGKDGALSINFLEKQITDFKQAFAASTDPEQTKKFGDALQVLQIKQQQLIDSGLSAANASKKLAESHGENVKATQRLSSSFLGLGKIFDVLPEEANHLTHAFEGIVQSFERVSHGTEGTGEKVKKFAEALGSVGLGLAISIASGLLVNFVTELLHADGALEHASEESLRFKQKIEEINRAIEESKANIEFLGKLGDLTVDINFGKGFEGSLLKAQGGMVDLQTTAFNLGESLKEVEKLSKEAENNFSTFASDAAKNLGNKFILPDFIPDDALKSTEDLDEADKKYINTAKELRKELESLTKQIEENSQAQRLAARGITLLKTDEEREKAKKANDEFRALFESRANIIDEFTKKFASIKDPFPSFFTDNLPLGKVNDKLLREVLGQTFKQFKKAYDDGINKVVNADVLPFIPKFQVFPPDKSAIVREIEDTFGEIKKEVEDGINKGIIEVPIEFRIPEGNDGKAIKVIEDRVDQLAKGIEGLTGQRKAILDLDFDANELDPAKIEAVLEDLRKQLQGVADGTPITAEVNAEFKVNIKTDKEKVLEQLDKDIVNVVKDFATSVGENLGNAIGDALSGKGIGDAFKQFGTILATAIGGIGKALIAAGVKMALAKAALSKLFSNPAIAIAAGIALVALSKVLQNSIGAARAVGGRVREGLKYVVNEIGPEIFQPKEGKPVWLQGKFSEFIAPKDGRVIPALQAANYAAVNNMPDFSQVINNRFTSNEAKGIATRLNIPKFEFGGVVSGPTFGLIGEGASISASNPEIIAPLSTLKSILFNPSFSGSTESKVKLRGSDLILSNSRTNRDQRRNT